MQQTLFDTGLKCTMTDLSNDTNSKHCYLQVSEATTSTKGTSLQLPPSFLIDNITIIIIFIFKQMAYITKRCFSAGLCNINKQSKQGTGRSARLTTVKKWNSEWLEFDEKDGVVTKI